MLQEIKKSLYRYLQYAKWIISGKPTPANSYVKQYLIRKAFIESNTKVFIETGTLHGRTLEVLAPHANTLYSIELDKFYFERAQLKFKMLKHVHLLQGDSAVRIHEVLKGLKEPAFFWLDAHFSGGDTGQGAKDTPIVEELQAILNHSIKGHIIWIDDARCFDGTHDYPTIEALQKLINRPLKIENDIIQIG